MTVLDIRRDLTIVHSNIRHLYSSRAELTQLCNDINPDILTLNETHLNKSDRFTMPGYTIYRKDRNRRGGGVAILCKDDLPCSLHKNPPQFNNSEHLTIKIHIRNFPIFITAIYLPPSHDFPLDLFTYLNSYHKALILGDLNTYHTNFGDNINNRTGILLNQFLQNSPYRIIPTGPTRLPDNPNHRNLTSPDKILVTHTLRNKVIYTDVLEPLNSDHCCLRLQIATPNWIPTRANIPKTTFKYHKADWEQFRTLLTDLLPDVPPTITDLKSLIEADNLLLHVTNEARLKTIPHKTKTNRHRRELPTDIVKLIKTKRRAHRLYMRIRTEDNRRLYRQLQQEVRDAINRFETRQRQRLASNLDQNKKDNPGKFWQLVKKLRGNTTPTYPLKQDNNYILQTTSKLHIFKNHLQSIHTPQHEPSFDANNYTRITNHIQTNPQLYTPLARIEPHINNNPPTPLNSDITTNEVSAAIYRTRNTAAGPDNIPNILFKHYPNKAVEFLATLYTASFRLGALPPRWKHAHILLFPKPGKDLTNVNNYRPISLTLTICKLLERILNRRLQLHIDDAELIPNTQAGFRPHINIVDQLLKILTPIELAREQGQTAAIVALDLQRAFDTVWHDGLRYKLTDMRLPPQIIRWISDFLTNRTAQVKINHELSEHLTINRGVPQGTVLSPLLYNLFVADIPTPRQTNVRLGQFADDTVYTVAAQNLRLAATRINKDLKLFTQWLQKWRLQINVNKTQVILIKKQRFPSPIIRDTYPIRINHTPIPYQRHLTYLGVKITNRMKLTHHIYHVRNRIALAIKLLYNISGHPPERPSPNPRTNLIIYTSIIRPAILYASQLFSLVADTQLKGLAATERRLIRWALHLPRNTNSRTVYALSKIKPIVEYIRQKNIKYVALAIDRPFIQELFQNPPPYPSLTVNHLLETFNNFLQQQHL